MIKFLHVYNINIIPMLAGIHIIICLMFKYIENIEYKDTLLWKIINLDKTNHVFLSISLSVPDAQNWSGHRFVPGKLPGSSTVLRISKQLLQIIYIVRIGFDLNKQVLQSLQHKIYQTAGLYIFRI